MGGGLAVFGHEKVLDLMTNEPKAGPYLDTQPFEVCAYNSSLRLIHFDTDDPLSHSARSALYTKFLNEQLFPTLTEVREKVRSLGIEDIRSDASMVIILHYLHGFQVC